MRKEVDGSSFPGLDTTNALRNTSRHHLSHCPSVDHGINDPERTRELCATTFIVIT